MQERIDHHHSALTSFHRKRQIAGWMFAIPAVIFLCVFVFYPVLYNVWLSFTNAKRLSSDNLQFAGLKNYITLLDGDRLDGDLRDRSDCGGSTVRAGHQ